MDKAGQVACCARWDLGGTWGAVCVEEQASAHLTSIGLEPMKCLDGPDCLDAQAWRRLPPSMAAKSMWRRRRRSPPE